MIDGEWFTNPHDNDLSAYMSSRSFLILHVDPSYTQQDPSENGFTPRLDRVLEYEYWFTSSSVAYIVAISRPKEAWSRDYALLLSNDFTGSLL